MVDLNKTPKEIADDIIAYYDGATKHKVEISPIRQSVFLITNMMQVCPIEITKQGRFVETSINPKYNKLSAVLVELSNRVE